MSDLKIRIFRNGRDQPATTVTIPGNVLRIASNLIPNRAAVRLRDEGIDIEELVALSERSDAQGTLVSIEDHEEDEQVVIALE